MKKPSKNHKGLSRLRSIADMTLREFSKLIGIDFGFYCLLEQGVRKVTDETLNKISIATGVSIESLRDGTIHIQNYSGKPYSKEFFDKWIKDYSSYIEDKLHSGIPYPKAKIKDCHPTASKTLSELVKVVFDLAHKKGKTALTMNLLLQEIKKITEELEIIDDVVHECHIRNIKIQKMTVERFDIEGSNSFSYSGSVGILNIKNDTFPFKVSDS